MIPIGTRRLILRLLLTLPLAALVWLVVTLLSPPFRVLNAPGHYDHREGALGANISVALRPLVFGPEYRLNGGPWRPLDLGHSRAVTPLTTLEFTPDELRAGENLCELRHRSLLGTPVDELRFTYDPAEIRLPLHVDWSAGPVEVQDGWWTRLEVDGGWRVRPEPGYEGYDRILLVVGAIQGGRRVETEVTFRSRVEVSKIGEYGFGVFSLWGGHPDEPDRGGGLRRGWRFAMSWFWSKPGGVGNEISERVADGPSHWVNTYRDYDVRPGSTHRVVVETQPAYDQEGVFHGWRIRSKWWPRGADEPQEWMVTWDREGAPLPDLGYGVGLMALLCQVEYGPVEVEALPPLLVPEPGR
ncbi:MAG: hypothetical protein R3F30_02820 [Planctomycetota bacterium]